MTTAEQERCWEAYEYVDDLVERGSCVRCGGTVESWTEEVDCCGYPYTCTDTLYRQACHSCKAVTDGF